MFHGIGGNTNKCDNKLYETLGVAKDASNDEIKKAYKKMALKHHPDRNRNNQEEAETKFKEISKAYGILSDPQKRSTYDKFGMDFIEQSGDASSSAAFDIFENLFGGMGGMSSGISKRKGKPRIEIIEVSLNDFYECKTINLNLKRDIVCPECNGSGALNSSSFFKCSSCDGSGITIQIQQLGPGFISQSRSACQECNGVGTKIIHLCKRCNGKKVVNTKCNIKLPLTKNMVNGEQVIYDEFANYNPDVEVQGDLIIQVNEKKHPLFTRKNNDLYITLDILLSQALCGGHIEFTHLDNRKLYIELNDIINPNDKKIIPNEGMYKQGDLILTFNIIMPKALSPDYKKYLNKLLPISNTQITSNHTKVNYKNYIKKDSKHKYQRRHERNEHANIGEQVQCAQQ